MRLTVPSTTRAYVGTPRLSKLGYLNLGCVSFDEAGDCLDVTPDVMPPPSSVDLNFPGLPPVVTPDTTMVPTITQSPNVTPVPSGSGTGLTPAQIAALIASGAQAGVSIVKSTQSPYVIPGTNIIANPGNTPIVGSPTGVTGAQVAGSFSKYMPLLAVSVFALLLMQKGGR